jgi:hypothetical protein
VHSLAVKKRTTTTITLRVFSNRVEDFQKRSSRLWFQASVAMLMRPVFFSGITQRCIVIVTDVSGQHIGPIFKGQEVQEEKKFWTS